MTQICAPSTLSVLSSTGAQNSQKTAKNSKIPRKNSQNRSFLGKPTFRNPLFLDPPSEFPQKVPNFEPEKGEKRAEKDPKLGPKKGQKRAQKPDFRAPKKGIFPGKIGNFPDPQILEAWKCLPHIKFLSDFISRPTKNNCLIKFHSHTIKKSLS